MPNGVQLGDDSAQQARALVGRLLAGVESQERPYVPERLEIPIADVELAVERFATQRDILASEKLGFPCIGVPDGRNIPVDVGLWGPAWYPLDPGFGLGAAERSPFRLFLENYLNSVINIQLRPQDVEVEPPFWGLVEPSKATEFFRDRLETFLAVRFSARQSDISTSPGLQIRVDTRSHGLRVHFSPAYFFNPANVLGSPTSPVIGWLQPGRYILGACAPGLAAVFDLYAEYNLPPTKNVALAQ